MWVDRKTYTEIGLELAKVREEARVLNDQNRTLRTSLEWLMVRVTQLEKERAALVYNYMGVKVEVPDIQPSRPAVRSTPHEVPLAVPATLGFAGFQDMGDEEAARHGIGWDDEGKVTYSEQ